MIKLQERVHGVTVPAAWYLGKLRRILTVRKGNRNTGMQVDNLLSLSYGRIVEKDIDTDEGLLPASFETYQIVEPGDIVLRLTDLQNDKRSLRQGLVMRRGIITSAYDALKVADGHEARFWAYALLALDLAKYYYSLGGGVRQSIGFADFPNEWIGFPDHPTQRRIADFLDRETARIDQLTEKKQRLLEVLEERIKAITKRLAFGRHLTWSRHQTDVAWVPDLPEGWLVQRTARLFQNLDSRRIPLNSEERADLAKVYPYYGASGIIDYVDRFIFDEDLILVGEDGANLVMQSTPVAFIARGQYWVNNHAHILKPLIGPNEYWVHVLNQVPYEIYVTGSAQPKLTSEALGNIPVPVPPVDVQYRIAQEIDLESNRIRDVEVPLLKSVDKLRAFRSSLITAAVTGQIDPNTWRKRGNTDRQLEAIAEEASL